AENYPVLKSNDNVKMLQEELSSTENKIGFARQFYNDIVTNFNTAQEVFPTNIFAGMFGFKPAELFQITDAADRDVPVVDLGRKNRAPGSDPRLTRDPLGATGVEPPQDVDPDGRLHGLSAGPGTRLRHVLPRPGGRFCPDRDACGARNRIGVLA